MVVLHGLPAVQDNAAQRILGWNPPRKLRPHEETLWHASSAVLPGGASCGWSSRHSFDYQDGYRGVSDAVSGRRKVSSVGVGKHRGKGHSLYRSASYRGGDSDQDRKSTRLNSS